MDPSINSATYSRLMVIFRACRILQWPKVSSESPSQPKNLWRDNHLNVQRNPSPIHRRAAPICSHIPNALPTQAWPGPFYLWARSLSWWNWDFQAINPLATVSIGSAVATRTFFLVGKMSLLGGPEPGHVVSFLKAFLYFLPKWTKVRPNV